MKNMKFILVSLFVLLTLSSASIANTSTNKPISTNATATLSYLNTKTVEGQLLDDYTGDPTEGVVIVLEKRDSNGNANLLASTVTDSAGSWVFTGLNVLGEYCVHAIPNNTYSFYYIGAGVSNPTPQNRNCFSFESGNPDIFILSVFRAVH